MNGIWQDHYSILQIHFNAEPDMINGAYRLLSKKYHPDLNKGARAEELMKRLNVAYGVLGDAKKRAAYNVEWLKHNNRANINNDGGVKKPNPQSHAQSHSQPDARPNDERINAARAQIASYYGNIIKNDYEAAYECISAYDRARIKKAEFIEWQTAVGKIYELRSCEVEFYKPCRNVAPGGFAFNEAYEFNVAIHEREIAKDRHTQYKASKIAVYENGGCGVYLGYSDVKPFVVAMKRGESVTVDAREAAVFWLKARALRDNVTDMLNYNGFINEAKKEESRYKRHGDAFSIAVFEILRGATRASVKHNAADPDVSSRASAEYNAADPDVRSRASAEYNAADPVINTPDDVAVVQTGRYLADALRDTDISCRWKGGKFIVLFAGINAASAKSAASRVCSASPHPIRAGVCEYDARSVASTIRRAAFRLAFDKRGALLSVTGVFTRQRKFKPRINNI